MADDYKTEYSRGKNVNTTQLGSFNDWGDNSPARQTLARQPDGDIYDVVFTPKGENKSIYNEVAAAPVGSSQLITTYTVPASFESLLKNIFVSGDNLGQFQVKKNGSTIYTARTWWADFNASIPVDDLKLIANDKIEVFVTNRGSMVAPFESTIGVNEYAV
mgnify:CR=1 FL=1